MEMFDYFIEHQGEFGVTELSHETGYSKSVIHRILSTLEASGYLAVGVDSRRYRLGYKSLQLGLVTLSQIDVRRLALPRLHRLRDITRETVNLGLRFGDKRVYIESLESPQEIRQRVELGREMSLVRGASSKAVLAFIDPDERDRILLGAQEEVTAQLTAVSVQELRAELAAIQIRGYATSVSERLVGAFSVAAPVFDHHDEVIGSVSISGPVNRWRADVVDRYGELLNAEIGLLSRDLGSLERRPWQEVTDSVLVGMT